MDMKRLAHSGEKYTQRKRRAVALLLLLCFFLVSMLAQVFIFMQTDHPHDHDGAGGTCAVCAQIKSVENTFKQLGLLTAGALAMLAGAYAAFKFFREISVLFEAFTPVKAKCRMNN